MALQLLSMPTDTHVVGFSDQPLFVVQNVPDTANQLHGAAVVGVLEDDNRNHQWPPGSDHTTFLPVPIPQPQLFPGSPKIIRHF